MRQICELFLATGNRNRMQIYAITHLHAFVSFSLSPSIMFLLLLLFLFPILTSHMFVTANSSQDNNNNKVKYLCQACDCTGLSHFIISCISESTLLDAVVPRRFPVKRVSFFLIIYFLKLHQLLFSAGPYYQL